MNGVSGLSTATDTILLGNEGRRRVAKVSTARSTGRGAAQLDAGFGLVEIVVSMFLLALLAVAFLPLLIESLRVSVTNSKVATANQILSEQLDAIALVERTCAAFDAFDSAPISTVTDARGTVYQAARTMTGCPPSAYPAPVSITLTVSVVGDSSIGAKATTSAIVERAN